MKICVLVPSESYIAQAGVRIRYRRIEDWVKSLGHEFSVVPLPSFTGLKQFTHDVYLISKCYDSRVPLIANLLTASDKAFGIDLFDDYFSQVHDQRFSRFRLWMRTMSLTADFFLCSTPMMADIARSTVRDKPTYIMNDPAPPFDPAVIGATTQRKLNDLHQRKVLTVAWFGMGDNPHFSVGLDDLVAFGGELGRLRGRGLEVRLNILTNQRAMTAERLSMLRRLPVPYLVKEWTEEREAALLANNFACFLPVNAQNFSTVKSLNRAVTALASGTQVLSSGFPLYEPLAPFLYRDPVHLLADIERRQPALRSETLPDFMKLMGQYADPEKESRDLVGFLEAAHRRRTFMKSRKRPAFTAMIHGRSSSVDFHKFTHRQGGFSVSSPFCSLHLNFDLRFSFSQDGGGLEALIADKHRAFLSPEAQARLSPHGKVLDHFLYKLDLTGLIEAGTYDGSTRQLMDTTLGQSMIYSSVMETITEVLRHLFPGIACHFSEQAELPWWSEIRLHHEVA